MNRALVAYAALSAADTALAGFARGRARRLRWLTKPALMPTLTHWVHSRRGTADDVMTHRTLAGLGLSAVGDVALLRDDDAGFLGGVGAFLSAHVAYIAAFRHRAAPVTPGTPRRLAPVAAVWATALPVFASRAGSLRVPVLVYGTALAAMQASALQLDSDVPPAAQTRIAGGAACFLVSDTLLAAGRFLLPQRHTELVDALVMATYTAAQGLIAGGVAGTPPRGAHRRTAGTGLSRRRNCR